VCSDAFIPFTWVLWSLVLAITKWWCKMLFILLCLFRAGTDPGFITAAVRNRQVSRGHPGVTSIPTAKCGCWGDEISALLQGRGSAPPVICTVQLPGHTGEGAGRHCSARTETASPWDSICREERHFCVQLKRRNKTHKKAGEE